MAWSVTKLLKLLLPFYGQYPIPVVVDHSNSHNAVALKLRHAFVASAELPQSFATSHNPPQILFNDILVAPDLTADEEDYTQAAATGFHIRIKPIHVNRAKDQKSFQEARRRSIYAGESTILDWEEHEILAPDTTHRPTVMELARITGNAYFKPGDKGWYEVGGRWNSSFPFGWDPVDNGFRGNVFVSDDNSTVVLSIKGTSLLGQGPTASRDKLNDNRLFSCCCARVSKSWAFSTVCDCYSGGWACTQTCLEKSLQDDDLFYNVGIVSYRISHFTAPISTFFPELVQ
jgi:putative lipase involved disintegration of autophagic bodies